MQSYVGCMTFWPLSLPLLSPWCFIISPRLILVPCRMPFESCLCHFVGKWELFFGIHVHFKELYVFGTKLVTMATIVKGYWPSVIIWVLFTPTLWTFFGHSYISDFNWAMSISMCTTACLAVIYVLFPIEMWYHVLEFCMTFWPFYLPILSMWSFFISPRLILIQFRIHFELCWYNLSDSGTFLCFLCMYQCIYCIWVILVAMETTVKSYWPSIIIIIGVHPNLVTTFRSFLYVI